MSVQHAERKLGELIVRDLAVLVVTKTPVKPIRRFLRRQLLVDNIPAASNPLDGPGRKLDECTAGNRDHILNPQRCVADRHLAGCRARRLISVALFLWGALSA
jgi:hypothetical protein